MTTRLRVLLVSLACAIGLATAYWLCPQDREITAGEAMRNLGGPLHVVRIQPVSIESIQAFIKAVSPWLEIDVVENMNWALDERNTLSWEGDMYDVDLLLDRLTELVPRNFHVMGLTDQPMHDDAHWWLYGKSGGVAIVSTAHLWADDAEGDARHPLFRERLAKVGVHEFGHHIGFNHCDDSRCVMKFSSELSTLDETTPVFCRACLREWLKWQ